MAISGYTDLAKTQAGENEAVSRNLEVVSQGVGRAIDLVKQILSFSRQQDHERKPVQLRHVVKEALKLLRATIPTTVEFKTHLAADTPIVLADATQVHQILMNLGTNAWHAMRDTPGRLEVSLASVKVDADLCEVHPDLQPGDYARLSVSDTGHGMDEKTLARIFEPFFTTKAPGEGTGLGLSVVHGIMKSHDGAITVYSQAGGGTTFHLYFPGLKNQDVDNQAPDKEIPRGLGQHVLIIDDEPQVAELGKKVLERTGYRVTAMTNPSEGLELVRNRPMDFDLILTDLTMPGMTGVDLAREILCLRPGCPIILVTGYTATLTLERVRALGIRDLLLKPVPAQTLACAIHRALQEPQTK